MALFRVYENGKPIDSANYLKWNPKGAAADELVFVSGHPGSTQRLNTLAELLFQRDYALPNWIAVTRDRISVLQQFSATSAEREREASSTIFFSQNTVKALTGELQGLDNPRVIANKKADEDKFQSAVASNPDLKAKYATAWTEIAAAEQKASSRVKETYYHSTDSQLSTLALNIVEYVAEIKKPDGERLPGFHESQLESLRVRMFSPAPIYPDMEIARITGALHRDVNALEPDDPFVKAVLGGKTPEQAATDLVNGTKLRDPQVRKALVEGGQQAVDASTDSFIVLARKLDPIRREFIKWQQDKVESVEQRSGEQLGRARFALYLSLIHISEPTRPL